MPSFLCDVTIQNVVLNNNAIKDINATLLQRISVHNATVEDERHLTPLYIVRFDNRGYRTFSADEAWSYYTSANRVERLMIQANCPMDFKTNHITGEQIEIRLDASAGGTSHLLVGGESKDWVETTFSALNETLTRRKNMASAIMRTQWMILVLQFVGVFAGLLLCLWLATLSAPYLKNVEYPRALSFGFWFLVYSNLWAYLQQRTLAGIHALFPNVRFTRSADHWAQSLARKVVEAAAIAVMIWIFALVANWAASVLSPFLQLSL